jgi:hypothetical protein
MPQLSPLCWAILKQKRSDWPRGALFLALLPVSVHFANVGLASPKIQTVSSCYALSTLIHRPADLVPNLETRFAGQNKCLHADDFLFTDETMSRTGG